ncbi:hypothetical protein BESB_040810 [Besnoitia besnoiti]|uniref:Uncharacterized protein n=1 Tax=Besnoitia besnoiti TaxID=94643 RepID=A0A2A9MNS9_BESBE|nr:hypothetical protein BESB_040810 [Besnoitia besnoiti]PFH37623.1 hypothetical protein BESB_040810 [Besnoitia besnoiti]
MRSVPTRAAALWANPTPRPRSLGSPPPPPSLSPGLPAGPLAAARPRPAASASSLSPRSAPSLQSSAASSSAASACASEANRSSATAPGTCRPRGASPVAGVSVPLPLPCAATASSPVAAAGLSPPTSLALGRAGGSLFSAPVAALAGGSGSFAREARRFYTPPAKRTWSKQHSKIYTRRPLTERYAPHKLHPEQEWWRERALQPSSLFMGFPDLLALPLRGGFAYISEMDAPTLAIVLASLGVAPAPYSISEQKGHATVSRLPLPFAAPAAFAPVNLPQHLESLLQMLGRQAAAVAVNASDTALAYLFRGCAEAGIAERSVVCTLVGRVETRLPRIGLADCLVLLEAVRPELPAAYRPPRLVEKLVQHVELLIQFRGAEIPAEDLCDVAHLLVSAVGDCSPARLQFLALSLVRGKSKEELHVAAPRALARAMAAFARARDALNLPLLPAAGGDEPDAQRGEGDAGDAGGRLPLRGARLAKAHAELFCASPLLRAYEANPHAPASALLQLSLLAPVVQALHRAEKGCGSRRGGQDARGLLPAEGDSFAAEGEGAQRAGRGNARAAQRPEARALTEAAALAAASVAEEASLLNRESTLRRGLLRCLERVDDNREQLSPDSICNALYAAAVVRTAPSRVFFPDLLKRLADQLGACTVEDLSRALFALVRVSSSSLLPPRSRDLLAPLLGQVLEAVKASLPQADVAALARLHHAAAAASIASLELKKEELLSVAEETCRLLHARLEEAAPSQLVAFVRHLDRFSSLTTAEFRRALITQSIVRMNFFNESQLARLLDGVTRLASSSPDDEQLAASTEEVLRHIEGAATTADAYFSPASSLRILVSLARLRRQRTRLTAAHEDLILSLCDGLTAAALPGASAEEAAGGAAPAARESARDLHTDRATDFLFLVEASPARALGDDAAETDCLQSLSAESYIQLLRALRELGVEGGVVLTRVAHLLHMKRYDLTEAQEASAAEVCASLGLDFEAEEKRKASAAC